MRPRVPTRDVADFSERNAFAKKYRKMSYKKWVFSDETIVSGNEMTGRTMWCFPEKQNKRPGAVERPIPIEKKSRFNVCSVQVWGCVGYGWKSPLVVLPAIRTDAEGDKVAYRLDKRGYVRRCLSKVAAELVSNAHIFVQDGARCHDNSWVRDYCSRKGITVAQLPPYSPDMNMIECIWGLLKKRLGLLYPQDNQDLIAKVKQAWNDIPQADIDKIIRKYPAHLEKVFANGGRTL